MNIDNLTETDAKALLKDLCTWPDVEALVFKGLEFREAYNRKKASLLQMDQNLADEQLKIEDSIRNYDCLIEDYKNKLKQYNRFRGACIKKLNAIKANRELIHKEWIENFANK